MIYNITYHRYLSGVNGSTYYLSLGNKAFYKIRNVKQVSDNNTVWASLERIKQGFSSQIDRIQGSINFIYE